MRIALLLAATAMIAIAGWRLAAAGGPSGDGARLRAAGQLVGGVVRGERAAKQVALTRLVGQRIMTRMTGTTPGPELSRRVRRGQVGGVILFADNIRSLPQVRALTARLQRIARAGGNPPLLIATDQEGGSVKRFAQLPPFRAPAELGRPPGGTERSAAAGEATGHALRELGVTVDLAPVADVRRRSDSFLGTRAFGTTAGAVAKTACAFARGLRKAGVAPTLKHFPGLGMAGANTDLAAVSIDASAQALRADFAPYRACAQNGLIMMSSAAYPHLTGPSPAVLTRAAYARELGSTGFNGVTISDDLQTPALQGHRGFEVRAARAGLDVLLFAGTESAAATAYQRLLAAARSGRLARPALEQSYARVVALKAGFPTPKTARSR